MICEFLSGKQYWLVIVGLAVGLAGPLLLVTDWPRRFVGWKRWRWERRLQRIRSRVDEFAAAAWSVECDSSACRPCLVLVRRARKLKAVFQDVALTDRYEECLLPKLGDAECRGDALLTVLDTHQQEGAAVFGGRASRTIWLPLRTVLATLLAGIALLLIGAWPCR